MATQSTKKSKPKPKNRMGRPSKITSEVLAVIVKMLELGLSRGNACIYAGVNLDNLANAGRADQDILDTVKKAEVKCEVFHLNRVREGKHGWTASAWMLERTRNDRYGAIKRNEQSEDALAALKQIISGKKKSEAEAN